MERFKVRGGFLKKIQLPVIGGIRKVITPGSNVPVGTTIAEVGSGTISLAQLTQIISQIQAQQTNTGGGNIGKGDEGTLIPGPGLAGGGPLVGNVPIRLIAPIPWFDDAGGGGDGDPGPPGMPGVRGTNGATGGVGPMGPAIFMAADEGQDGDTGPTGAAGTVGAAGLAGPAGPAGTTLVYANSTIPGGNTIANTSSETFFTSSYVIPAGSLTIGMVLRVKLFGVYSTGIVAPSLALKMYFGATVMIASGTLTTVANVTNDGWSAEGLFIVQTIGVAGTVEAQGLSEFSTASTAVLFVNMDNAAPVTVNTTVAETIQTSVQWGGTVNASDTITLREMTVEVMTIAGVPISPIAIGPSLMLFGEDGEEGSIGPPGPAGASGTGSSSSNPFNVTPDTHTTAPLFLFNDEYEFGSALDTIGTRFTSAVPWTWYNQAGSTAVIANGAITLTLSGSGVLQGIKLTAPATPWSIITKQYVDTAASGLQGLFLYNSGNTNAIIYGPWFAGPGNFGAVNFTAGAVIAAAFSSNVPGVQNTDRFLYFRIDNDGANLTFSYSVLGYGYTSLQVIALATFIGTVTDFGLGGIGALTQHADYFRGK